MSRFTRLGSVVSASIVHASIAWLAASAAACPDCPAGRAARSSVFGQDFMMTLAMIVAPLLVLAVIAAVLHRTGLEP